MIRIQSCDTAFVREPLASPFGFKGGYLTELWQAVVKVTADGVTACCPGTQSVLWSDPKVFASFPPEKADETKNGGGKKDKSEGDLSENAAAETPEKGAECDGRIDDENRKSAEKEDGKTDGIADSAEKTDEKGEKTEKSEGAADGYNAMEEIIKKYLLSIIKSRPPVTPASGTAVVVPPRKPKSPRLRRP